MSQKSHKSSNVSEIAEKPKKKRGRIFLKVTAVILCIIIAYIAVTAVITAISLSANKEKAKSFAAVNASDVPVFENYSNGCWNIHTDKELKVLQLTDIHIGGGYLSTNKDSMALNAVAAMITAEKPDFVIVTGDIAYPVPFQAGTLNNKSSAGLFAELMESLGVYWTVCYGNHDTESYSFYSREDLTEFYSSGAYPHCLLQAGPEEVDGVGNQVFNVVNSDNIITRSFILMDSHSYIGYDIFGIFWHYDNIHDNQIEWYKNTVAELSKRNEETISNMPSLKAVEYSKFSTVKTSVFMHIPLTEYRDAWNEYVGNGYTDTENVKYNYGTAGESGKIVYCGMNDDNLFETMLELGSTDSVFCGHDHLNNFSVNYKGIDLNYGMSVDYLAYSGISKLGTQRGCKVIEISTDGSMATHNENYYQDKYLSQYAKEEVTMQQLGEAR